MVYGTAWKEGATKKLVEATPPSPSAAGAALQPITPTAANPFCGISDWKLNMK